MRGFDGGGAGRHPQTEATCGQVTASSPTGPRVYKAERLATKTWVLA